jgi:hypothetical protein
VLIYFVFMRSSSSDQGSLVSSPASTTLPNVQGASSTVAGASVSGGTDLVAQDFLTLLLNVKNIKLDDSIFSDPAFNSLHDSSIVLVPDVTTGRPNPFAKFGAENIVTSPPATPATPIKPKS